MSDAGALNEELLAYVAENLPEDFLNTMMMLALSSETGAAWEQQAYEALAELDWDAHREDIAALIGQLMPLETLVPEVYARWRPIVRDAVRYVGLNLSKRRMLPKLVEQLRLPMDMSLEQRLIVLIARMPSLQKIGQIVARNQNLDPAFRAELTRLENAITNITMPEIRAEIERQLGDKISAYDITIADEMLAEASVSATVRFTWHNPFTKRPEHCIFKVMKPYVQTYFSEELDLLQGLADFFDTRRGEYGMPNVEIGANFKDIKNLLAREVNYPNEQKNLGAAYRRYLEVPGVRTPRLIRELCTPTLTAVTEERGVKVTAAFRDNPAQRHEVARHIVEGLVGVPLFSAAPESIVHADPHAGNLYVDETNGDLLIFDWALTEPLSRPQRRYIILLVLMLLLRDEATIFRLVDLLALEHLQQDATKRQWVKQHIAGFMRRLSPLAPPGFAEAVQLVDELALRGVRFPPALLMFRKALFTLEGVLNDVMPDTKVDPILVGYALSQMGTPRTWLGTDGRRFEVPLNHLDFLLLNWSFLLSGGRYWGQTFGYIRRQLSSSIRDALDG